MCKEGQTPWEIGNCGSLFILDQFQAGVQGKVDVEALSYIWRTEKSSSWRWPSSFDNTLNTNLASSANINPAIFMEDLTPESTPHGLSLLSWLLWENMIWSSSRPTINQIALYISFKIVNQRRWLLQRLETVHPENSSTGCLKNNLFSSVASQFCLSVLSLWCPQFESESRRYIESHILMAIVPLDLFHQ